MDKWINRLDQMLIAIVFVVILSFIWFIFAVSGAFVGINLGYRLWIQLWLPLFQPALGLLMAAALGNWAVRWLRNRRQSAD